MTDRRPRRLAAIMFLDAATGGPAIITMIRGARD